MKKLEVKAIIITDGVRYFIHGCDAETPIKAFKAMTSMWEFDPSKEEVHCVRIELAIPEYEALKQILVEGSPHGSKTITIQEEHDDIPGEDPRMDMVLSDCKLP
jgi:hypothetical protein